MNYKGYQPKNPPNSSSPPNCGSKVYATNVHMQTVKRTISKRSVALALLKCDLITNLDDPRIDDFLTIFESLVVDNNYISV